MTSSMTIQGYRLELKLGKGVYATVYKAIHQQTRKQVAMKVIQASKFKEVPKLEQCIINQIKTLSSINGESEHIVRYIDMLKTNNNFFFVYEFCNEGTLDKLMLREGPFPEKRALIFTRQIFQAFKVLSKHNTMHRDLKPDNILLHNGMVKLADFGFCKPLQGKNDVAQTMLGSPIYMAPQVLKGQIYTVKADVWSLGVVIYQMLFGRCPFQSRTISQLIEVLNKVDLNFPSHIKISSPTEELLRRMIVKDPAKRVSWDEIFNEYVITDSGQIHSKREQKMELRSSLKGSSPFALQMKGFTTITSPNQQMTSPKINRSYEIKSFEDKNNLVMKKKSPYKPSNGSMVKNQYMVSGHMTNSDTMNFHSPKTDRSGRLEMLLKNHYKSIQINQMVLEINNLEQRYCIYVSCLLLKTIEKELLHLYETLKKQVNNEQNLYKSASYEHFKEFKLIVEKEYENLRQINQEFLEQLSEKEEVMQILNGGVQNIERNKQKILKLYIENLKDTDEDLRLASQIIDYLEESILIKKDAYERMSKDHLQRQIKNKLSKF